MQSGQDLQRSLRAFAQRWDGYDGSERGEAQTFLNELIACYGQDRRAVGARFEDPQADGGILDLHWPDVCIVEMKAPREALRLEAHRAQALNYWHHSDDPAAGRPAPPYVVLCAFQRFEVWEPGRFPSAPRVAFALSDLPEQYEVLDFLARREALFHVARRDLTTDATARIIDLSNSLTERGAGSPEVVRGFALQVVWCLFAESLGMLSGRPVERIVDALRRDTTRSSAAELGHLFAALDDPTAATKGGVYEGTPYANGGLFAEPARVHLLSDELELLAHAASYEWRKVEPTIFGSLMEGYLGHRRRWELGAHYTHPADIMKIVTPTIVRPWRERIEAATTIADAEDALAALCDFTVLDPACGCGNFLYLAYRELRTLEAMAKERVAALHRDAGATPPDRLPSYPIRNMHGIEVSRDAFAIARVTLWMGHKLAADEFGLAEPVLPLVDLSNVQRADALRIDWPEVDAIIGNPPFNGSQHLRRALGDEYVEWLKVEFGVGVKDFCVYWFRKAHEGLAPGGRAGLVGTNSISQNRARGASLDYVTANGGVITDAVSTQKWPGEARVHVSLVNWIKDPGVSPHTFVLDEQPVTGITSELRSIERSTAGAQVLAPNRGVCFQGPIPVGDGFILADHEAHGLLSDAEVDYAQVVRPYLIAQDIAERTDQSPSRWIIDFGMRTLEQAIRFPRALKLVRERVRPERKHNRRALYQRFWWRFGEARPGMRNALHGSHRFLAGIRTGKRVLVSWYPAPCCPSDLVNVFALDDDYGFGVLSSGVHTAWAQARSSTLKGDVRYTPTSVFATFPWPEPDDVQREAIAGLAVDIVVRRQDICRNESIGLTELYNRVDDGAYRDLLDLHRNLDRAIVAAYGWPAAVAGDADDMVRRLLDRNVEIAAGGRSYAPFGRSIAREQTLEYRT